MRNLAWLLLTGLLAYSCALTKTGDTNNDTLMTLAGDTITAEEFIYLYEKNNFNNDSIYSENDVNTYLELFQNFKLKVRAAEAAGIDTTQAFKSEYKTYKDQLIRPYLAESRENDRLVQEAYEHMQWEIDAAHIMVSLSQDALPEDTLVAYNKIDGLLKSARSGIDFEELAFQYSEDPSAKTNKGRLGYFTAFQMVYSFEEAAFNTPVDSISGIIRSQFGYHILKVLDKRPYSGKVKVSHIMLLKGSGSEDFLRNKIFEIHDQATGGADWNELCRKYSEDERTKDTGGTLPVLGLRQINDQAFESVAFALKEPGDISDPVQSQFGWHIIRLEEKIGLENFDQLQETIKQQVSRDDRSKLSHNTVIQQLKETSHFREDSLVKQQLVMLADSTILQGKWKPAIPDSLSKSTLYFINGKPTYVSDAVDYILSNQRRRNGLTPGAYMAELIDKSIENALIQAEEMQLISSNRDVRMLLNEYYEGILLFEIMNRVVWEHAMTDTTGLKKYYENNLDKYQWGERADAYIIETSSEEVFQKIKNYPDTAAITLMELAFKKPFDFHAVEYPSIDSLIAVHRNYPDSRILLNLQNDIDEETAGHILDYLLQNGVAEESVIRSNDVAAENILTIKLNSKSKKSLEFLYNRESALTLRVTEGLFERGKNPVLDSVAWETGRFETRDGNEFRLIGIRELLASQPKKFEETRGAVISDYQQYLEQEWIRQLRQEYAIILNERTIDQIKIYFNKKHRTAA
ncbi:MAG: peptidylprolyl isomerase [Cyclobacteriaceae bacterium]|nr:peptidylprolyl isomerase [Cyclobacteriaceae bacterium]